MLLDPQKCKGKLQGCRVKERECGGWRRVSESGVETGEKTKHKRKTLELPLGKYWFEILNSGFALKLGEQNLKL